MLSWGSIWRVAVLALLNCNSFADDALPAADIRCLVVAMRFSAMPDPAQQHAGKMLTMFYLGKLDHESSKLKIEDAIFHETNAMTPSAFQAEAARCGKILLQKAGELDKIGKDLLFRAQQSPQKSAPKP